MAEPKNKVTPLSVANVAVARVVDALSRLNLPYEPRLLYSGLRNARYSPSGHIETAFANVLVSIRTPIDYLVRIEVLVPVIDGKVLDPTMFVYAGNLYFLNKKNLRSLLLGGVLSVPRVLDMFNNPHPVKFPPAATGLYSVGLPSKRIEGYPGSLNWAL